MNKTVGCSTVTIICHFICHGFVLYMTVCSVKYYVLVKEIINSITKSNDLHEYIYIYFCLFVFSLCV